MKKPETKFNDDLYNAVQAGEIDENSKINVDVFFGPIGSCGFRSGNWSIEVGGIKFKMFSSIPHQMDLSEQEARLIDSVKNNIARAIEGETYINKYSGGVELKYASQMHRVPGSVADEPDPATKRLRQVRDALNKCKNQDVIEQVGKILNI